MKFRAAVALGSNLGNRIETLQHAITALRNLGSVSAVSALYETDPIGGPEQSAYLNAVVVIETDTPPPELMRKLLAIESEAGRVRVERWGPRTLDLDLIAVQGTDGPLLSDDPSVILPHPRAAERRFVLEPLAEVWPTAPLGPGTAATLLDTVNDQEVFRLAADWVETGPSWVSPALVLAQFLLIGVFGVLVLTGSSGYRLSTTVAGAVVALGGAVFGMWATRSLGAALTPFPEPRHGTVLVESGPYGVVRHPIYSAVIAVLVGLAIVAGSVVGLGTAAVIAVFFWFKAGYEESRLRLIVPGYAAYSRRVRGRLLPR